MMFPDPGPEKDYATAEVVYTELDEYLNSMKAIKWVPVRIDKLRDSSDRLKTKLTFFVVSKRKKQSIRDEEQA